METLYNQTNGMIQEIQHLFQKFNTVSGDTSIIESEILKKLDTVNA